MDGSNCLIFYRYHLTEISRRKRRRQLSISFSELFGNVPNKIRSVGSSHHPSIFAAVTLPSNPVLEGRKPSGSEVRIMLVIDNLLRFDSKSLLSLDRFGI
jgi:hypothetical protein